jgi:hypothetical protein
MQSKPPSRGTAFALDADEPEIFGGRETVLAAKLMDDDDADAIVRCRMQLFKQSDSCHSPPPPPHHPPFVLNVSFP